MFIVTFKKSLNTYLKPTMKTVKLLRDSVDFAIEAKVDEKADSITLTLCVGDDALQGAAKRIEFDDCFLFEEMPAGVIDVRDFATTHPPHGIVEAYERGLGTLITSAAKLTIEITNDDRLLFEVIVGRFITCATCPASNFVDFLTPAAVAQR